MRTITTRIFALAVVICSLLSIAGITRAQEVKEGLRPSFESGPYVFNLGLTAGYRSSDITNFDGNKDDWATNRYYEAYNLRTGFNLNSFSLFGERKGDEGFFDELYANAYGINDPFTTGSLRMRAFNKFDFKVDFRQAKYFMNRDDSIFTGMHKYDMTRDFLNASLDINATEDLKFNLKFNSVSRSGNMTTTMSPFVENGETLIGSYVGGIYRGDFYWLSVPKNDKTTEFSAGINYKLPASSSISLGGGLRSFTQEFTPTLVDSTSLTYGGALANGFSGIRGYSSPVVGKNYAWRLTPLETLDINSYTDHRESSGPFAYFQGVTRPMNELTVTADLRYESSSSKPWLKYDINGVARTGATITYDTVTGAPTNFDKVKGPYAAVFDGSASTMDWSSLVANVAITGKLMDGLNVTANLGMSNIHEQTTASNTETITGDTGTKVLKPITATGSTDISNDYKIPQQSVDAFLSYNPTIEGFILGVKAGVKYADRNPTMNEIDGLDSALSRHVTSITPYISVNARPVHEVRFDARLSQTSRTIKNPDGTTGDMTVRTAPEKILNASAGLAVEPMSKLNIALRYNIVNGTSTFGAVQLPWTTGGFHAINLPELDYTNDLSSITATIGYYFKDIKLGFNLSGQYRANKFSIPTTWTRGNEVPINYPGYIDSFTVMIQQNTIDRYGDFSLTFDPMAALHLEGGVSITRSTGEPSTFDQATTAPGVKADGITPLGTPTAVVPDQTHFGGPYSMQNIHVAGSYDVTPNIGINAEFQHVSYKEDKVDNFWALNNFAGNLIRGGFTLKF